MFIVNFFKQLQLLFIYSFLILLIGCADQPSNTLSKIEVPLQLKRGIDQQYKILLSIINHQELFKIEKKSKSREELVSLFSEKESKIFSLKLIQDRYSSSVEYTSPSFFQQFILWTMSIILTLASLIVILITVTFCVIFLVTKFRLKFKNLLQNQIKNPLETISVRLIDLEQLVPEQQQLEQINNKLEQLSQEIVHINIANDEFLSKKVDKQEIELILGKITTLSNDIKSFLGQNHITYTKAYEIIDNALNKLISQVDNIQISQAAITELTNEIISIFSTVNSFREHSILSNQESFPDKQNYGISQDLERVYREIASIQESHKDAWRVIEELLRNNENLERDRLEEKFLTKIANLDKSYEHACKDIKDIRNILDKNYQEIENLLQQYLHTKLTPTSSSLSDYQESHSPSTSGYYMLASTSSASKLSPPSELLATYYSTPELLEEEAIKVSPTEESYQERRSDYSKPILFEVHPSGKYWVMSKEDSNKGLIYWLFPTPNMDISDYNSITIKFLFKGNLGQAKSIDQLKLRKPARVSSLNDSQKVWQLEEPGELNLISG